MRDENAEAKDATHRHDSINVVLIAGLCALTVATYAATDVAADRVEVETQGNGNI